MTINAIETTYAGCRFRSRLEARWVVFFDHLRIDWQYETQGYQFDGDCYLPDFSIRARGAGWVPPVMLVEVKGTAEAALDAIPKLSKFVEHSRTHLLVVTSIPRFNSYPNVPLHPLIFSDEGERAKFETCYFTTASGDGVFFKGPRYDDFLTDRWLTGLETSPIVVQAYEAARSARFEYGAEGGR